MVPGVKRYLAFSRAANLRVRCSRNFANAAGPSTAISCVVILAEMYDTN